MTTTLLLRAVAHTLKKKLRGEDLVVRVGGDEFVCGLAGTDEAAARARLADVNGALAADPEHGSVTIGVAELAAGDSLTSLLARADAALYLQREQRDHPAGRPRGPCCRDVPAKSANAFLRRRPGFCALGRPTRG